jgi:hypothetical protein
MSWQRIVLPLKSDGIDPTVLEIGRLGMDCYERANKPAGFGMFHATEGLELADKKFIVYLTPVASELCSEIAERFSLEPCEAPAYNDQDIAFVFGDPKAMGLLKGTFQPQTA